MTTDQGRIALAMNMVLLATLTGCADLLDLPSDPAVVATGPWRCLRQPRPTSTGALAPQVQVRIQACDFITDCTTSVSGLTAKLCDKRDVGCNSPRLSGLTETNGEFRFQVPTAGGGFNGYLLVDSAAALCTDREAFGSVAGAVLCGVVAPMCNITAPDAQCYSKLFAPAMSFFNPPITADAQAALPLQMFPTAGLPAVLAAAGVQIDPSAGNVLIQALDCDGRPAAGVTYEIAQYADQVSSLYVANGLVSNSVTRTDSTGIGGFVGVPPGFISVVGYNSDSVAVGEIGVQTAPSTLTYTALSPAR